MTSFVPVSLEKNKIQSHPSDGIRINGIIEIT